MILTLPQKSKRVWFWCWSTLC